MAIEQTFKFLDKDIEWEYKGNGKYDRKLVAGDFVSVEGMGALKTSMMFTLLTGFNELYESLFYDQKGNRAKKLLKTLNNDTNLALMREDFIQAINQNKKVKSLNMIELTKTSHNGIEVYLNITSYDDQSVSLKLRMGGIV